MKNISLVNQDSAEWAKMRDWCIEQFGKINPMGEQSRWDYSVGIGPHGRFVIFSFDADQDLSLFALRWVR